VYVQRHPGADQQEGIDEGGRSHETAMPPTQPIATPKAPPPAREGFPWRWTAGPPLALEGFRGPPAPYGPELPGEHVIGTVGPVQRAPTLIARVPDGPRHSWHPQQALLAASMRTDPVPDPDSPGWAMSYASAYYASAELVRQFGDRGPPGTSGAYNHPDLVAEWLEETRRAWSHPDTTPPHVLAADRELIQWINDADIRARVRVLRGQYYNNVPRTSRAEMAGRVRKLLWAPSAWHPDEMSAYQELHHLPRQDFLLRLREF
jgi:hypothetical protein